MYISKVNSKGGVTIPAEIRLKLGIKPGTKVTFIEKDGIIMLWQHNKKYFQDLARILGEKGKMLRMFMKGKKEEVRL